MMHMITRSMPLCICVWPIRKMFANFIQFHYISPVIKELGFNKMVLKGFSLDLISLIYMFFRKKKFAKIGQWKTT